MKSKLNLYEHNKESYENIKKLWKETSRVAIVQATGTGKSFVISRVLEDYSNKSRLVLAPTNHIIKHLKDIDVYSESSVYMTYSKLSSIAKGDMDNFNYELIVLDEFHRCGAREWGKAVNKLLDNNLNAKVLGATATHIRYLDGAMDMSKELFDNYVASNIDLTDAINKGLLKMPIFVTSLYSVDEEINNMKNKIEKSKNTNKQKEQLLNKLSEAKDWSLVNGVPDILSKYIKEEDNKFIVFCKNKSHLDKMTKVVQRWFEKSAISKPIKIYEVSCAQGSRKNEIELGKFSKGDKSSIHLLFSIDILNEGIHVPDVSGVLLMRETASPNIFYQQIGRAMEVGKNENPLIFDFVNNFSSLKIDDFRYSLNQSRKKLKDNNEDLKEIDFTIYDETVDFRTMLDEIDGNLVDSWELMYLKLEEFFNKKGHTYVSRKDPKYKTLYKWINKQRVLYGKGELKEERIERLEGIDFVWNVRDKKWMDMYLKLRDFYNENGHTRVPEAINKSLCSWCSIQRCQYSENKLEDYQVSLLEDIEFIWKVLDTVWNDMYKQLIEFKNKYHHVNVPRRYPENKKLANWCQLQKSNYKSRMEKGNLTIMSEERIKLLEDIGFIWDLEDYNWNKNLKELENYYKETNDLLHKDKMSKSLRDWTSRQRQSYRKGKLLKDRVDKLNKIGFIWDLSLKK